MKRKIVAMVLAVSMVLQGGVAGFAEELVLLDNVAENDYQEDNSEEIIFSEECQDESLDFGEDEIQTEEESDLPVQDEFSETEEIAIIASDADGLIFEEETVELASVELAADIDNGQMTSGVFTYMTSDDGVTITGLTDNTLKSIVIPGSIGGKAVVEIGMGAFENNKILTSIVFPENLESIEYGAFYGCSNLSGNLNWPESLNYIGSYAFCGCEKIGGTLEFLQNVSYIGDYAFAGCIKLTGDFRGSELLSRIGASAFAGCSGLSGGVYIPESVKYIGEYAFENCSGLSGEISFSKGLKNIGAGAFLECNGLSGSLILPEGLTSIGTGAFSGCSGLNGSLFLPEELTSIGAGAFSGCSSLKGSLNLPSKITTILGYTFEECNGLSGSLILPEGLTSIGTGAFSGCSGLSGSVDFPEGLTSVGSYAFEGCRGLTGNITLSESVAKIDVCAFNAAGFKKVYILNHNCEIYALGSTFPTQCIIAGYNNSTAQKYAEKFLKEFELIECNKHRGGNATCKEKAICEICTLEYGELADHIWEDRFTIDKDATCKEMGSQSIHCSYCGTVQEGSEKEIPVKNHTVVKDEAVAATCTKTGLTEGSHCSVCGDKIIEQEITPVLGHTVVKDEAVAATCTKTGLTEGSHCSVCGDKIIEQEITPVLGHTKVVDEAIPATEKENGLTEGSHCSVCGEVLVAQKVIKSVLQYNELGAFYEVDPISSGNINNAITLEAGQTYYREYSSGLHSRYWYTKFEIKENSYAEIGFTAKNYYEFSICDEKGIAVFDYGNKKEHSGYYPLKAGIYYVVLNNKSYSTNSVVLTFGLSNNDNCELEPNDYFSDATELEVGKECLVFTGDNSNKDYFCFNADVCTAVRVYVDNYERVQPSLRLYEQDRATYHFMDMKYDVNKESYYYEFIPRYSGTYFIMAYSSKTELPYGITVIKQGVAHGEGEWRIEKAATCTTSGVKIYNCNGCGETKREKIPATGHSPRSYSEIKQSLSCVNDKIVGVKCNNCYEFIPETLQVTQKAQGHQWDFYRSSWNGNKNRIEVWKRCKNSGHSEYRYYNLNYNRITLGINQSTDIVKVSSTKTGDVIKSWTSKDASIATVSNSGKITGKKVGSTVIYANFSDGFMVPINVTVQKNIVTTSSISVSTTPVKLKIGETHSLNATVSPITSSQGLTYKTSNKKVATVSSKGVITAKKAGTTTITAVSGKQSKKIKVTVTKPAPTGIKNVPTSKSLQKGKTFTIKPKVTPTGAEAKFIYSTSDSKVVTVSKAGKVTAKKAGTATIIVKAGSIKVQCKVTVTAPAPKSIKNVPAKKTLKVGKTLTLKPKLSPTGAEAKITYTSSDESVAVVSSVGKITAKKKGTATITVKAGKISKKCKITVK